MPQERDIRFSFLPRRTARGHRPPDAANRRRLTPNRRRLLDARAPMPDGGCSSSGALPSPGATGGRQSLFGKGGIGDRVHPQDPPFQRPSVVVAVVGVRCVPWDVPWPLVPGVHQKGKGFRGCPRSGWDRRLEEVAKAVGGGYCRLQMPLRPALAVGETVGGRGLCALEEGGGDTPPPSSNASLGLCPPPRPPQPRVCTEACATAPCARTTSHALPGGLRLRAVEFVLLFRARDCPGPGAPALTLTFWLEAGATSFRSRKGGPAPEWDGPEGRPQVLFCFFCQGTRTPPGRRWDPPLPLGYWPIVVG